MDQRKREATMATRRQRERIRRRNQRIRVIRMLVSVFCVLILLVCGVKMGFGFLQKTEDESKVHWIDHTQKIEEVWSEIADEYADNNVVLDEKRILDDWETESLLRSLAEEDAKLAEIYTDRQKYPEELLRLLCNNTEMTEFVEGYLTADKEVNGGFSEEERKQDNPLFLQWDGRWGYAPYGDSCIGISGCAPTCLSMVIYALTGNEEATPDALAAYSMENGHYVKGVGTAWTLLTAVSDEYGVSATELGLDEDTMKRQLDGGGRIICSMRPGDFTTAGHFIVIYGYDSDGFLVNDPNSRERSEKHWTFDTLHYQIKNLWGYR